MERTISAARVPDEQPRLPHRAVHGVAVWAEARTPSREDADVRAWWRRPDVAPEAQIDTGILQEVAEGAETFILFSAGSAFSYDKGWVRTSRCFRDGGGNARRWQRRSSG